METFELTFDDLWELDQYEMASFKERTAITRLNDVYNIFKDKIVVYSKIKGFDKYDLLLKNKNGKIDYIIEIKIRSALATHYANEEGYFYEEIKDKALEKKRDELIELGNNPEIIYLNFTSEGVICWNITKMKERGLKKNNIKMNKATMSSDIDKQKVNKSVYCLRKEEGKFTPYIFEDNILNLMEEEQKRRRK